MDIHPHLVEKPWAGKFIAETYGPSRVTAQNWGEAFLISTLENCESTVNGIKLSQALNLKLPFLVKIIDAAENLSIQVHPNDYWAKKLENSIGKSECWLILEASEGSGIYLGFKDGYTFQDLSDIIQAKGNVSDCVNFVTVSRGDFITVPAGTIHAIGKGVRILEFQQASGITYRIWDWGREDRELHLKKAKAVISSNSSEFQISNFFKKKTTSILFEHDDFKVRKISNKIIECSSNKVSEGFQIDFTTLACRKI